MKTGDRVRKRGFGHEGVIEKMDTTWATMRWDDGFLPFERPAMCHVRELEYIEAPVTATVVTHDKDGFAMSATIKIT